MTTFVITMLIVGFVLGLVIGLVFLSLGRRDRRSIKKIDAKE